MIYICLIDRWNFVIVIFICIIWQSFPSGGCAAHGHQRNLQAVYKFSHSPSAAATAATSKFHSTCRLLSSASTNDDNAVPPARHNASRTSVCVCWAATAGHDDYSGPCWWNHDAVTRRDLYYTGAPATWRTPVNCTREQHAVPRRNLYYCGAPATRRAPVTCSSAVPASAIRRGCTWTAQ